MATKIELTPEDELLVQRRLEGGTFATAEGVIHKALESLDAEQPWLDKTRAKIQRGLEQLDRGEVFTPEESLAHLEEMQAAWRAQHRQG